MIIGIFFVVWYGWIIDDAYIYFRYVDNLVVHKVGLVYNAGEFVEGFSSPLWTILLSIFRLFHLNYWIIIRVFGILVYIFFWYLAKKINYKLSRSSPGIVNFPLLYLTCTYGVMCSFTSGLETPLVVLESAGFASLILFPDNKLLQVLVGLSPLFRHELVIPYLIILIWIVLKKKQFPFFLFFTLVFAGSAYGLFRIWYYADLFPNTFYLKNELWISQGLTYLYETCSTYQTLPVLGIFIILYFTLRKQYGKLVLCENERLMMILTALPVLLFVIKIGGDPRHFRYLAFPFCLILFSTAGIAETALSSIKKQHISAINALSVMVIILFISNFPRQLQQHPVFRSHWGYSHNRFLLINDAAYHRFDKRGITPSLTSLAPEALSYSAALKRNQPQKGNIITRCWCQAAYLQPNDKVIQSLGLTEPFLARINMRSNRPAHKLGLRPLAKQILSIRKKYGFGQGVFSKAIYNKDAQRWMVNNEGSLRQIEAKAYNKHSLWKNFKLAFTPVKRIKP